jgi:hypothetical protein
VAVRLSLWQRSLIVLGLALVLFVPAYAYLASQDIDRTLRKFTAGRPVTWPPAAKAGGRDRQVLADRTVDRLAGPGKAAGLGLVVAGLLVGGSRLTSRRRRAGELATFELRLGRDDFSNPFRVQETLEGIVGAISARWYRRLWRGQDHFALEVHRGPTGLVAFTLATRRALVDTIAGALEALYPDVRLIELEGRPSWQAAVTRLKKRRSHVLSLLTLRNYEHAFSETLVALLAALKINMSVQLVLTPAPVVIHARARRLFKQRERRLNYGDRTDLLDPGMESVVEGKELKQALETQHHSLCYFDLRVAGDDPEAVRRVAGLFSQLRAENELTRRDIRIRRRLYAARIRRAQPNPLPALRTGILSSSELSTLWQLPAARAKNAPILRSTMRRALATPEICRVPAYELMRDEHGPVGLAPADRKYGHALIGGQGGGKTSCLARHLAVAASDPDRAIVVIDGKGPLAQAALGMIPTDRTVHYLDFARPELGLNPLQIGATPGATAAMFVQALVEANPPGAIQAASDSFLRQAISAVCAVETQPTLWHVYRMLDFRAHGGYRDQVIERLDRVPARALRMPSPYCTPPSVEAPRAHSAEPSASHVEALVRTRPSRVLRI